MLVNSNRSDQMKTINDKMNDIWKEQLRNIASNINYDLFKVEPRTPEEQARIDAYVAPLPTPEQQLWKDWTEGKVSVLDLTIDQMRTLLTEALPVVKAAEEHECY